MGKGHGGPKCWKYFVDGVGLGLGLVVQMSMEMMCVVFLLTAEKF